ncbi:MAG TPA: PhzF family phenazine biosynthesis protein [Actinomycetota bacterium]|nr:PhzF family phenazine biosynthesis protein [Actinomycetota bacterium]
MRIPFRLLDVFTPRPLAGNQLCVIPERVELETETMQALAREIGFSETTFVNEAGGDRYAMRIFTPGSEIPFAGHPTLGTAFVLVAEGRITSPATQVVAAGEFRVEVDLDERTAWMTQLPAVFGEPLVDRALLADAAGVEPAGLHPDLPSRPVSTGLPFVIVPVRDLDTLRSAGRHGPLVADVCRSTGSEGLYLFAVTEEGITARMFDREEGIGEDPATGSAAGPLAAYLAEHELAGMPDGRVLVRQGEQVDRPSELHVEVGREAGSWRPRVGGGVHVVGGGEFVL